jgi:hypothetical protein
MVVKEMEGRRGRDEEGGREELRFLWGDIFMLSASHI